MKFDTCTSCGYLLGSRPGLTSCQVPDDYEAVDKTIQGAQRTSFSWP